MMNAIKNSLVSH